MRGLRYSSNDNIWALYYIWSTVNRSYTVTFWTAKRLCPHSQHEAGIANSAPASLLELFSLLLHRNRLQLKVPSGQQRPRPDEFPRWIILC